MTTGFTQPVSGGSMGDTSAGYAGGVGYSGQVASGDLEAFSSWTVQASDFDFRVQQLNPACP
jgi:hypothetical protein